MRSLAALLALLLLAGCSSTRRERVWEIAAGVGTAADIASTQLALRDGGHEGNPVFGAHPRLDTMLTVNALAFQGVRLALRDATPQTKRRTWRAVAILRFAVAAYNLARR